MKIKKTTKPNIGPNLLRLRLRAELTQTQLAAMLPSITQSAVARWETGDRTPQDGETLRDLANALECRVSDLLPGGPGCVTQGSLAILGAVAELLRADRVTTITTDTGEPIGRLGPVYAIAPEVLPPAPPHPHPEASPAGGEV